MKIQIKNRFDDSVIFETDAETLREAVLAAIADKANLGGANLNGANLGGADLSGAYLSGAYLIGANLGGANLGGADLSGANLSRSFLSRADLSRANLNGANLGGADLSWANLDGANFHGADLSRANLGGADLSRAFLSRANLGGADLSGAYLSGVDLNGVDLSEEGIAALISVRTILPEGSIIGWKKLRNGNICKLQIPADSKRVGGLIGRKCRCEYAIVLEGSGVSSHDGGLQYEVGKEVRPDEFDPNPLFECSKGIHFFITREEAEAF